MCQLEVFLHAFRWMGVLSTKILNFLHIALKPDRIKENNCLIKSDSLK